MEEQIQPDPAETIKKHEDTIAFLLERIKLLEQRHSGLLTLYNAAENLRELDGRLKGNQP